MKKYVKADWNDDDYVNIGGLMLPRDASDYGYQSAEEISRQTKKDYQDELARREREAKRQKEAELGLANYEKAFAEVDPVQKPEDQLEFIFNALVPSSGKCDNLGAELVRAMMRVLYRDWNDGDVFYDGYGLETCVSDAAFVMDKTSNTYEDEDDDDYDDDANSEIYRTMIGIAADALSGREYTAALNEVTGMLINYLRNHPELFGKDTEDCRSYKSYTIEEIKDAVPTYEYECDLSGDLERYIDNDCISWDDIEDWLDDMCYEFGGQVNQRALDWYEIDELSPEQYETWEREFPKRISSYLDYLEEEYPNYGESEDEEEYYDEEDEDEE